MSPLKKFNTQGIILNRTEYAEADRIITFLTPNHGKVKAIAKGVRKSKSKLAGGIELFSISDLSFIVGRSEINTLASTRLIVYFGSIVKDLDRTNLAYEIIKTIDKATEDSPEQAYFDLLKQAFESLNDPSIDLALVEVWFKAQLLKLAGHAPNLKTEKSGESLQASQTYNFNFDDMAFQPGNTYKTDQIKFLRLVFSGNQPKVLQKVQSSRTIAEQLQGLVRSMLQAYVRI
jgi:DNA repair protein RecO